MDLDSRTYSKLIGATHSDPNFGDYRNILEALCPLGPIYNHETPEMWCSRIHNPFRKILKENSKILSKNGYMKMFGKLIERSDRVHGLPSNYIYCSVYDSLVFIPENSHLDHRYRNSHLKRCISGNIISNEQARREEILESIDSREFWIWQCKQEILREEVEMKRLQLELASQSQSLSHSEKDKLASVSYDFDCRTIGREAYAQAKASMAKNTMPSAPNFEPACISPARQEMISPTSYQSSGVYKSKSAGELFVSSRYAKQPKGTVLRLRDGTVITIV
jgi:hypothetical protein